MDSALDEQLAFRFLSAVKINPTGKPCRIRDEHRTRVQQLESELEERSLAQYLVVLKKSPRLAG